MIEVSTLHKRFKRTEVLHDLSFQVGPGEVLGVGGSNGSGKSVLLSILAAQNMPTSGTVRVAGYDVHKQPREVKRCVGYVATEPFGYTDLLVEEYLAFWAAAHNLPKQVRATVLEDSIALAELEPWREQLIGTLSRGLRQRVELARAILHDPQVLLFDEPLQMLDTSAAGEWRRIVAQLAALGKTVVLASGQLWCWFPFCQRLALLHAGRLVAWDTLSALCCQHQIPHRSYVRFEDANVSEETLESLPEVLQAQACQGGFQISHALDPTRLLTTLVSQPWALVEFRRDWASTEGALLSACCLDADETAIEMAH